MALPGPSIYLYILCGDGVLCAFCMAYSVVNNVNVSFVGLITSVGRERADFLLSITRNRVVSVRRGFLPLGA